MPVTISVNKIVDRITCAGHFILSWCASIPGNLLVDDCPCITSVLYPLIQSLELVGNIVKPYDSYCEAEFATDMKILFEFVMPAIDMVEEKNDLVVRIDLPGFTKDNINLRIAEDILTINARREEEQEVQRHIGTQYYRQRPLNINRKVVLPFSTSDGEKVVGTATHQNGIVTLRIPIPKSKLYTYNMTY